MLGLSIWQEVISTSSFQTAFRIYLHCLSVTRSRVELLWSSSGILIGSHPWTEIEIGTTGLYSTNTLKSIAVNDWHASMNEAVFTRDTLIVRSHNWSHNNQSFLASLKFSSSWAKRGICVKRQTSHTLLWIYITTTAYTKFKTGRTSFRRKRIHKR